MKINVKLENGMLPDKYGKYSDVKIDGEPCLSFPITVEDIPAGAKTLALTFIDYDSAPLCGFAWKHWLAANIPADIAEIPENASQDRAFGMVQGKTDFRGALGCRYGGPMPPDKTHNYTLTLFALDCELALAEGFTLDELETAMKGHILETAEAVLPSRS